LKNLNKELYYSLSANDGAFNKVVSNLLWKKAGCNGSVIQRPKALVANLQLAKFSAIYRA
jgi:hypothetical protein